LEEEPLGTYGLNGREKGKQKDSTPDERGMTDGTLPGGKRKGHENIQEDSDARVVQAIK